MSDPNNDDPFAAFGQDRTVIKPSAGRPITGIHQPARPAAPAAPGNAPAAAAPMGIPAGPAGREAPMRWKR